MRCHFIMVCALLGLSFASCPADEPSNKGNDASEVLKSAKDLLRRASELAAEQDEAQHYWTERLLLQIGDVQMRAGDFEGARRSIRAPGDTYGRNAGLVDLAEELAGAGKRQESLDILRELGPDHGWRQEFLNDGVRLRWIEHLIAIGDFERSQQTALQFESKRYRSDGLRELAAGYGKSGEKDKSTQYFKLALEAADDLDGFDCAQALWKTGEAQFSAGEVEATKATIRQLVAAAHKMETWPKVAALREAAVLSAKLKDQGSADSLLRQAFKSIQDLDDRNAVEALKLIALAQARAGYIDDALKAARMIRLGESGGEEALFAVAQAQLRADDPTAAVQTALSITHYLQYRDESLHAVVEYHVQKGDLKKALAAAEMVHNPSQRVSAILKTAVAYAKSGDKKLTAEIALRIKLTSDRMFREKEEPGFDYRRPDTWGVNYDMDGGFTIGSYLMSVERAAEVAKHAMTLAQTIPLEPKPNYVELFDKYGSDETQALARAHAATGDARDALVWAEHVGSDKKVASKDDFEAVWALKRRISAIVGVAEGLLDRQAKGNDSPIRR